MTAGGSRADLGGAVLVGASRAGAIAGLIGLVALLPWVAATDPASTVLRARYAEREATPEAVAAVRAELGLDAGPLAFLGDWLGGLLRGDLGTSWVSGRPVTAGLLDALGVSLTLMAHALGVALVLAVLLALPSLRAAVRGRPRWGVGAIGVGLTAVPEFVLALALLLVGAVGLGWFDPYGWDSPSDVVLPALALGLPAGGLLGRLLATALTGVAGEPWVAAWRVARCPAPALAGALLQRALPSVLGQLGLVVVGLLGGAVAVEQVFAIPGLGRAMLGAAIAQDLPALQGSLVLVLAAALVVGLLVALLRRALLGPAVGAGALPLPPPVVVVRRRDAVVPLLGLAVLLVILGAGLVRDPFAPDRGRLTSPSAALPFGADASGRDLLARVAHGALSTLGAAVLAVLACLLLGLVVGVCQRVGTGPTEVANAAPPVLAGLVVAAIAGPSLPGAVVAVVAVGWAPLAAHAAALVTESRAQPHVALLPVLGVGRVRGLVVHVLPAVLPPLARHAVVRLPATALALASLGFLGLGSQPPSPEWGRLLAEGSPYLERAPWTVLAPLGALVLVAVTAVAASVWQPRSR